jgi:dipeptidyl aminopeptidase/acylaminoacyl peptidase
MFVIYIIVGIILILIVLFGLMIKGYSNSPRPHRTSPGNLGITCEEIKFPTKNNRMLYGWWIPVHSECHDTFPTIVLVHGWNRNLDRLVPYIKQLYGKGYNLLAFDSRNHGSSDPDGFSSMLKFAEDISASIDFIEHQPCVDNDKIGVIGLSIGGSASVYASAHDKRIKKVVAVGAFANPVDIMSSEFNKRNVPAPLVWMFLKYVQFRIRTSFRKIAPVNNIMNSDAAILLVHGTDDETVPYGEAEKLLDAADKGKVQLLTLPGSGHSDCHEHPAFWEEVENFLEKWN